MTKTILANSPTQVNAENIGVLVRPEAQSVDLQFTTDVYVRTMEKNIGGTVTTFDVIGGKGLDDWYIACGGESYNFMNDLYAYDGIEAVIEDVTYQRVELYQKFTSEDWTSIDYCWVVNGDNSKKNKVYTLDYDSDTQTYSNPQESQTYARMSAPSSQLSSLVDTNYIDPAGNTYIKVIESDGMEWYVNKVLTNNVQVMFNSPGTFVVDGKRTSPYSIVGVLKTTTTSTVNVTGVYTIDDDWGCPEGYLWAENSMAAEAELEQMVGYELTAAGITENIYIEAIMPIKPKVGDPFYQITGYNIPEESLYLKELTTISTINYDSVSCTVSYSVDGQTFTEVEDVMTDDNNIICNIPRYMYLKFSQDVEITEE